MSSVSEELRASFRLAMRRFPAAVSVITAADGSRRHGMTATAVTSLSLDPPSLIVCINRETLLHDIMQLGRRFCVNVLRAGQEDLARVFASKRVAREKFEAVTHMEAHGVPVLDGALAWLACDLEALHAAGDHTIGIGAITQMDADPAGEPLVWFRGEYGTFA